MRRTNRRGRKWREIRRFCGENHRLLAYLFLWLVGLIGGLLVRSSVLEGITAITAIQPIEPSVTHGISQVFASCFLTECLLLILFVAGLSACGAPITAIVPLFYGLGLGITQAYWGAQGNQGMLLSALWIWPHSLIETIALLMGCCESLRLSLRITAQLLPGGTIGSLWRDFRLYITRFLLFGLIGFGAGIVDVLLRMFLPLVS